MCVFSRHQALRDLTSHIDVLPTVHGSAFFQRGETAVLCTATLAAKSLRKVSGDGLSWHVTVRRCLLIEATQKRC